MKSNKSLIYLILLIGILIISVKGVEGATWLDDNINGYNLDNYGVTNSDNKSVFNRTSQQKLNTSYFDNNLFNQSFTVCTRFNTTMLTGSSWLMDKTNTGGTIGFIIYRSSAEIRCYSLNTTNSTINIAGGLSANTEYHLCCSYDLENGTQTQYINGIINNTLNVTGGIGSTSQFIIGNSRAGTSGWNGTIDEFKIFNRVLSASEITQVYQNNQSIANLSVYYPFETNNVSVCTNFLEDKNLDRSFNFCNKTYYYSDSNTNGNFYLNANVGNVDLNFNGATILGNYGVNSLGVKIYSESHNNVTIRNLVIKDYWRGVDIQNMTNLNLINITTNNTNSSGIYCGACQNTTIDNAKLSYNTKDHLIYIDVLYSGRAKNITVKNSRLLYSNDNAFQDNSANVDRIDGLYVYNNEIAYLRNPNSQYSAINSIGSKNSLYYNNTIHNVYNAIDISFNNIGTGCSYGALNNSYYNNIIYNLNTTGGSAGGFAIANCTSQNKIYNNYYLNNSLKITTNPIGTNDFYVNETVSYLYIDTQIKGSLLYNYVGKKEVYVNLSNMSITNQLSQYPYNDIKNTSNNLILASNVDNYSLTLSPNQQIEVGNFTGLSFNLNNYPSGTLDVNYIDFNISVYDPDGIFNFTRIIIYNDKLNVVASYDNSSLNFTKRFTNLSGGNYYFKVFVFNDYGSSISSNLNFFFIDVNHGTANCTSNEHKLWSIIPLIVLAGILLYLLATIEAGMFGTIGFMITLVITLNLIANLINVILTSC